MYSNTDKMFELQVPTSRNITPQRVTLAIQIFEEMGFEVGKYQTFDKIYSSESFLCENKENIEKTFPRHVIGNLFVYLQGWESGFERNKNEIQEARRSFCGFVRRLAAFFEGAVVAKRVQYTNTSGRNTSTYVYKVLF